MKASQIIKLISIVSIIAASTCAVCIFCEKKFRKNYITVSYYFLYKEVDRHGNQIHKSSRIKG